MMRIAMRLAMGLALAVSLAACGDSGGSGGNNGGNDNAGNDNAGNDNGGNENAGNNGGDCTPEALGCMGLSEDSCVGDNLRSFRWDTSDCTCVEASTDTPCGEDMTCADAACVPDIVDPCTDVMCDEGERCEDGACVPDVVDPCTDVMCDEGEHCEEGACVPDIVDPCADVTCDAPPEPTCSGLVLSTFAATGTCAEGVCSYEETQTDCAQSSQTCVADGANSRCADPADPCEGVACDPAGVTCDGTVATLRPNAGVCDATDGMCDYAGESQEDCATLGAACVAGSGCEVALNAGDLVITEYFKDPFVDPLLGEWFEIYNPTDAAIDLRGLVVRDDDGDRFEVTGDAPVEIAAGDWFVFGQSADTAMNGGVPVDWVYPADADDDDATPGMTLGNNIDELVLENTAGVEIDRVVYGDDAGWPDDAGRSAQLAGSPAEGDNALPERWCSGAGIYHTDGSGNASRGTPGAENESCDAPEIPVIPVGTLVITELMINPTTVTDANGEYIEIFNTTEQAWDLRGVVVADADGSFTVEGTAPVEIAAMGYFVFGANADLASNGGTPVDYDGGWRSLNNGGDRVTLSNQEGAELDRVNFTGFAALADSEGAALELSGTDTSLDNDLDESWCSANRALSDTNADRGTPGRANSCVVGENSPPVADAGGDQTVNVDMEVRLDGRGSSDPEDSQAALTFNWRFTSRPPAGGSDALSDADQVQASFTPSAAGQYVVELSVTDTAGATAMDAVTITAQTQNTGGAGCLIISELIEGSSNNKAVELYNCGGSALDLGRHGLCAINGSGGNLPCTTDTTFSGSLGAGEVFVVCNPQIDDTGNDAVVERGTCDAESGVVAFNGDDLMLVFYDDDDDGERSSGDTTLDVFGELGNKPGSRIWEDQGFERCDFTPFLGDASFSATDRYVVNRTQDDFSGLGTAPRAGCP